MTNRRNGALSTGVTGDLPTRVWQHRNKAKKLALIERENRDWRDLAADWF